MILAAARVALDAFALRALSRWQPDEIRRLRKLCVRQRESARFPGWGLVTASRYENGALQDAAHDKVLASLPNLTASYDALNRNRRR